MSVANIIGIAGIVPLHAAGGHCRCRCSMEAVSVLHGRQQCRHASVQQVLAIVVTSNLWPVDGCHHVVAIVVDVDCNGTWHRHKVGADNHALICILWSSLAQVGRCCCDCVPLWL